jgi:hypothetical protein
VVSEAVKRGRAYAGIADGHFHPEVIDPDLTGWVLAVAVEHGDAAFFDALIERLSKTDNTNLRGRILTALGHARDETRSARALALSLDPRLHQDERMTELFEQAMDHRTRETAWRWLQDNFDALLAQLPEPYAVYLPDIGQAFCDAPHAQAIDAFFTPRADKAHGLSKTTRETLESIHLCTAQADAQRDSARQFLAAYSAHH